MLQAVTFDIDDTMFDRHGAIRQTLHIMMQEFNHIFAGLDEENAVSAFYEADTIALKGWDNGVSLEATRIIRCEKFLGFLGLNEKYADAVNEFYLKTYPSINIPVDGVENVLRRLIDRFPLGVISNGAIDVQYRKLERLGIRDIFDCIIISDEINIRKPDPRIFHIAAERLNAKPEECLHIGDSFSADVVGANRAGFSSCWLNPDDSLRSDIDIAPDFEIRSFDEFFAKIPDLKV